MTTTLLRITIILTAIAPLQAAPTTQPTTQPDYTELKMKLLPLLRDARGGGLAMQRHLHKTATKEDTTEQPVAKPSGPANRLERLAVQGLDELRRAGISENISDYLKELKAKIAAQDMTIAHLQDSLDKAKPVSVDVVAKIDDMYGRALFWAITLFGALTTAMTIFVAIAPSFARRADREELRKLEAKIANTLASADSAKRALSTALTSAKEMEEERRNDRDALLKLIKYGINDTNATIFDLQGQLAIRNKDFLLAVPCLIKAFQYYSEIGASPHIVGTLRSLLEMDWTSAMFDEIPGMPETEVWAQLDKVIEACKRPNSPVSAEDLADLEQRRAKLGPKGSATEPTHDEPEASDDTKPETPDNETSEP